MSTCEPSRYGPRPAPWMALPPVGTWVRITYHTALGGDVRVVHGTLRNHARLDGALAIQPLHRGGEPAAPVVIHCERVREVAVQAPTR